MFKKQILFIAVLALVSCHQKKAAKTPGEATPLKISGTAIKEVIIDNTIDLTNSGAMYTIDSAHIMGDVLSVFVNYSGGCKEHTWDAYSNGMFAKSLPPKIYVQLKHINNDDMCRQLINEELKFNITKLKNASTKSVKVIVGEKELSYLYK